MSLVFVNGDFYSEDNAKIHAFDRGFRFGESVFETMRVIGGEIFQLSFHLDRLEKGLNALNIQYNLSKINDAFSTTIAENSLNDGFLRCQISKGVGSVGYKSTAEVNTMVINVLPEKTPDFEPITLGVSEHKVVPSSCFPKGFKSGQSLNYSLAANSNGEHYDYLMLNYDGFISETSSSNIFWIKEDKIYTPSAKTDCIPGSIRDILMQNLSVNEVEEGLETLKDADSLFITNIGHILKPVSRIEILTEFNTKSPSIVSITGLLKQKLSIF